MYAVTTGTNVSNAVRCVGREGDGLRSGDAAE